MAIALVGGRMGVAAPALIAIPAVDSWFGYQLTYVLCAPLILSCLTVLSLPLLRKPDVSTAVVKAD